MLYNTHWQYFESKLSCSWGLMHFKQDNSGVIRIITRIYPLSDNYNSHNFEIYVKTQFFKQTTCIIFSSYVYMHALHEQFCRSNPLRLIGLGKKNCSFAMHDLYFRLQLFWTIENSSHWSRSGKHALITRKPLWSLEDSFVQSKVHDTSRNSVSLFYIIIHPAQKKSDTCWYNCRNI